jgi:hypothetical protein
VQAEGAVDSTVSGAVAAGRVRLAQEQELARMLEQRLPFSWGPRGLEPHQPGSPSGVAGWAGGGAGRVAAPGEAGTAAAAGPPKAKGARCASGGRSGSGISSGGGGDGTSSAQLVHYHHYSQHPETHIEPWVDPAAAVAAAAAGGGGGLTAGATPVPFAAAPGPTPEGALPVPETSLLAGLIRKQRAEKAATRQAARSAVALPEPRQLAYRFQCPQGCGCQAMLGEGPGEGSGASTGGSAQAGRGGGRGPPQRLQEESGRALLAALAGLNMQRKGLAAGIQVDLMALPW